MKEKLNVNSLIGLMVSDREMGKVRENESEREREGGRERESWLVIRLCKPLHSIFLNICNDV